MALRLSCQYIIQLSQAVEVQYCTCAINPKFPRIDCLIPLKTFVYTIEIFCLYYRNVRFKLQKSIFRSSERIFRSSERIFRSSERTFRDLERTFRITEYRFFYKKQNKSITN